MMLWLDDIREPWKHGFLNAAWAHTADEAITALKSGHISFASLDHDLSEEHYPWNCVDLSATKGTGYDVVLFLEANPEFWPAAGVAVHSMNPAGKARMLAVVERHYGRTF